MKLLPIKSVCKLLSITEIELLYKLDTSEVINNDSGLFITEETLGNFLLGTKVNSSDNNESELKEEIKRLNEVIQKKDELLENYTIRFADMATQAQTIATQAQILQAADKKKSIFSRLLLLGKGK